MNYETAKRLKDAGFPQKLEGITFDDDFTEIVSIDTHSRIPSLEELIGACGSDLELSDIDSSHPRSVCGWRAMKRGPSKNIASCGRSPSEAVANLWLKINETVK